MRQDLELRSGAVDAALTSDFPGLALRAAWCSGPDPRTARYRRARLDELDDRVRLAAVGGLRVDPIAGAYRAFARQIGLDPDVDRNPLEQAAHDRLLAGRFVPGGHLADALLIAMLETGVPLWALDAAAVHGPPRIAVDRDDRLVVADENGALAPLLAAPAPAVAGTDRSERVVVYGLRVRRVPLPTVDEAFWHVQASLAADRR
jgi:hypothetical protein